MKIATVTKILCDNPIYSFKRYAINRCFYFMRYGIWFEISDFLCNKTIYVFKRYAINRFCLYRKSMVAYLKLFDVTFFVSPSYYTFLMRHCSEPGTAQSMEYYLQNQPFRIYFSNKKEKQKFQQVPLVIR